MSDIDNLKKTAVIRSVTGKWTKEMLPIGIFYIRSISPTTKYAFPVHNAYIYMSMMSGTYTVMYLSILKLFLVNVNDIHQFQIAKLYEKYIQ